jgi:hypothetical protein
MRPRLEVIGDCGKTVNWLQPRLLAHDPEKQKPVFPRDNAQRLRGDHAQTKRLNHDPIRSIGS